MWSFALSERRLCVWRQTLSLAGYDDSAEALTSTRAAASVMAEDLERLRNALSGRTDALAKAQGDRQALEDKFKRLVQAAVDEHAATKAQMAAQLARLQADLDAARQDNDQLRAQLADANAQLLSQDGDLAALRAERDALKDTVESLHMEVQGATAGSDALRDKLAQERAAHDATKQLLEAERARVRALEAQLADRDGQASDTAATVAGLHRQVADLRKQLDAARAEATAAADRARAAQEAADRARQDAFDARDALAALQGKLADMQAALEQAQASEAVMRKRYFELDVFSLDKIARELKALLKQLTAARQEAHMFAEGPAKRINDYATREMVLGFSLPLLEKLGDTKTHMAAVIQNCLNETQKLHVGVHSSSGGGGGGGGGGGDSDGDAVARRLSRRGLEQTRGGVYVGEADVLEVGLATAPRSVELPPRAPSRGGK